MAGHMGDKVRTIQNLEIIKSDIENNLIFLKGSVPGSKNSIVLIRKTAKNFNKINTIEKVKKLQAQSQEKSSKNKTEVKPKSEPTSKTKNKAETEIKKEKK